MIEASERLASLYDLGSSPDWQALLNHFELGEGFAFIVLIVPNDDGAEVCRAALDRYLGASGKRVLQIPIANVEDLKHMAGTLLALQPPADAGAIWLARAVPDGVPEFPIWMQAWREGAARLNQFRNPLRRQFDIPLIFAGAPWLQQALRESAPDLWSVRTLVARVEPQTRTAVDGQREFARMDARPERGPDPELALAEANRLRAIGGKDLAVARLLYRAGLGFASREQWREAADAFAEALELRQRGGATTEDLADAGRQVGRALIGLAEYDRAADALSRARLQYEKAANVLGEANCIQDLGDIALEHSDHETARARFEEALSLFRRMGFVLGEGNCLWSLGQVALDRSDHETARARIEEALSLFHRVGSVLGEANCIGGLGVIALLVSDHETARARFEEALSLYRRVGKVLGEANSILGLGFVALNRSDHETARARFEEALSLYRRIEDVRGEASCIRSLDHIAQSHRESPPATTHPGSS